MTLWLDAQLPPLLAAWIHAQNWGIKAVAVREIGLRDASDPVIFQAARAAGAVVITKDRDFIRLLEEQGPPPAGDLAAPGQRQQRRAAGGSVDHPVPCDGASARRRALDGCCSGKLRSVRIRQQRPDARRAPS
jgi:hypothetical protein